MRIWANAIDYWDLKFAMTKAVKERFDEAGLSIPFPQQVSWVQSDSGTSVSVAQTQRAAE